MNHILAEYYIDSPHFYTRAISHATEALEMQQIIQQGDSESMWKDYYLVGKIHFLNNNFQNAVPSLLRAKELVIAERLKEKDTYAEMILSLSKTYLALGNFREAYSLTRDLYSHLR